MRPETMTLIGSFLAAFRADPMPTELECEAFYQTVVTIIHDEQNASTLNTHIDEMKIAEEIRNEFGRPTLAEKTAANIEYGGFGIPPADKAAEIISGSTTDGGIENGTGSIPAETTVSNIGTDSPITSAADTASLSPATKSGD